MIKVKWIYFTISIAIVLFIIIAGCISTQPHTTSKPLRPISVIASAQTGPWPTIPGGGVSPAGPPTWIAVNVNASSTDVPVIQLSTTVLEYDRVSVACENFGISVQHPLMPGQNASTTCGYRNLGAPADLLIVNGTPAVFIEGTLQNGQSFSYWTNDTTS